VWQRGSGRYFIFQRLRLNLCRGRLRVRCFPLEVWKRRACGDRTVLRCGAHVTVLRKGRGGRTSTGYKARAGSGNTGFLVRFQLFLQLPLESLGVSGGFGGLQRLLRLSVGQRRLRRNKDRLELCGLPRSWRLLLWFRFLLRVPGLLLRVLLFSFLFRAQGLLLRIFLWLSRVFAVSVLCKLS
jgi:hypothetical protein